MLLAKPFHKGVTIIEEGFIQFRMGPIVWITLDIVMRKAVLACQVPSEGAFARGGYARQQYDGLLRNHENTLLPIIRRTGLASQLLRH